MQIDDPTPPAPSISYGQFSRTETSYHASEANALRVKQEFEAHYADGYGGHAAISPPNADRPYWEVFATRFESCE